MNQTFYLSNVVPQDLDNNGGYWNRLEIYCRDLAKLYDDVWITSGPLWLPTEPLKSEKSEENIKEIGESGKNGTNSNEKEKIRRVRPPRPSPKLVSYQVIGPNEVSVPTHLYKVVLVSSPSLPSPLVAAFVVPNLPVEDLHLTQFQ